MESCYFYKDVLIRDEKGNVSTQLERCSSKFELKSVEFRHPDYKEENKELVLCRFHFNEVFGDMIEEDKRLLRDYLNAKVKFGKDLRFAKKYGEYFDEQEFYNKEHVKVDHAWSKLYNLRRKQCRLENCNEQIKNLRKVYLIRVYPTIQTEYKNLYFCCSSHWHKIKLRIGIEKVKKKKSIITLDKYTQKTESDIF